MSTPDEPEARKFVATGVVTVTVADLEQALRTAHMKGLKQDAPVTVTRSGEWNLLMDEYQQRATTTAIYPGAGTGNMQALAYVALGLTGEAGEIANKVKKVLRDDNGEVSTLRRAELFGELGDVLWYAAMLAEELGCSLASVASANLMKLADRQERDVIGGSGDTR